MDSRMVTEQCVPGRNFQSRHRAFGHHCGGPSPRCPPSREALRTVRARRPRRQAGRPAGLRTGVPFDSRKLLSLKLVRGQEPIGPSARKKT